MISEHSKMWMFKIIIIIDLPFVFLLPFIDFIYYPFSHLDISSIFNQHSSQKIWSATPWNYRKGLSLKRVGCSASVSILSFLVNGSAEFTFPGIHDSLCNAPVRISNLMQLTPHLIDWLVEVFEKIMKKTNILNLHIVES